MVLLLCVLHVSNLNTVLEYVCVALFVVSLFGVLHDVLVCCVDFLVLRVMLVFVLLLLCFVVLMFAFVIVSVAV